MTYALIAANCGDEPILLATARTLKAAQKRWDERTEEIFKYECACFLTPHGIVNYHGSKIPSTALGYVALKMDITYE